MFAFGVDQTPPFIFSAFVDDILKCTYIIKIVKKKGLKFDVEFVGIQIGIK